MEETRNITVTNQHCDKLMLEHRTVIFSFSVVPTDFLCSIHADALGGTENFQVILAFNRLSHRFVQKFESARLRPILKLFFLKEILS